MRPIGFGGMALQILSHQKATKNYYACLSAMSNALCCYFRSFSLTTIGRIT